MNITKEEVINFIVFVIVIPFAFIGWLFTSSDRM